MSEGRFLSRRTLIGGAVAGAGLTPTQAFADHDRKPEPLDPELVAAAAARLDSSLIALRRDLHRHPELAGRERRTAAVVAGRLRAAGLRVTTGVGGHGVVGVLEGAHPGRTVAYRADLDAVPAGEQIGGGPEAAHVCGHDIHTTVGVGVAEVLAGLRDRVSGTFVFVFQPAEEMLTGAAAMLAEGAFAGTRPTEIHALHCGPFAVGEFAVTDYGYPGLDRGTVTLTGPDAAARASRLAVEIARLGTISPPATPAALEQLMTDLQKANGPLAEFVYLNARVLDSDTEDRAVLSLSYRCWPEDRYVEVRAAVERLAGAAAGAEVSFPDDPFPAMHCPEPEARAIRRYLRRTIGPDRVTTMHAAVPFSGEDFALFLDRLPGTYSFLGVRSPGAGIETSYPHFGAFTPDERAIGHGVRAMAGWLATRARTR